MNEIAILISKYYNTIILYFGVIVLSTLLAKLSYIKKNGKYIFNRYLFWASFLILLIFLGFSKIGTDYDSYNYIFEKSITTSYWKRTRIEKGYLLFNAIIRFFTNNFYVFHFIWAFCMLYLIYSTIYKYKEYINPCWAILAYTTIFMFQSMNLIRMYLAIAIIFWGIRFIINNKPFKYFLVILMAFLIHRSAIIMTIPFVFWICFKNKGKYFFKAILIFLVFFGIIIFRKYIFNGNFLKYEYTYREEASIGSIWIIYYFPIYYLFMIYKKKHLASQDLFLNILFLFLCSATCLWILSYFVDAIGRANYYFTYVFMVMPSYILDKIEISSQKKNINSNGYIKKFNLMKFLMIIYFLFRAYMSIGYIETDGLQLYYTIFK